MSEIEKRARELLAAEYERRGSRTYAESLRVTPLWAFGDDESAMGIRAIIAALTPPEGYVLVPVEPTEAMLQEIHLVKSFTGEAMHRRYAAMIAARPEVFGG
jgi:hypothetical protein